MTHYAAVDKSEQQISILCIVRAYPPTTSGSYGWQTKYGCILKFLSSLQVKLFGFLLRLISVQCYYSVTNAF